MAGIWYKNAVVDGVLTDIEVKDGKIASLGRTDEDGIDLGGKDVFAGLIDIHCHGAVGCDALGEEDQLETMCVYFAKNGITTWYPTTGGSKEDVVHICPAITWKGRISRPIWRGRVRPNP